MFEVWKTFMYENDKVSNKVLMDSVIVAVKILVLQIIIHHKY